MTHFLAIHSLCLHGIRTENTSEQTKRQAGPHCARSSIDIAKVNTWIATSHIHAKVRQNLLEKIQFNTSTDHKGYTLWVKMLQNNNVELVK